MTATADSGFPLEDFADELGSAHENTQVGDSLLFTNERVRVWSITLEPGERVSFHCHTTSYFWVCTEPGRAIQRNPDGTLDTFDFAVGEVDFLRIPPELIHDLENVGNTRLCFVTVELLESGS